MNTKKTPQILASKSRHCKQPDKTSGLWPQMKTLPFMGEMCFVPLPFKWLQFSKLLAGNSNKSVCQKLAWSCSKMNFTLKKEAFQLPNAFVLFFYSDREDAKKMATDPMFKLEHGVKDQEKSKSVQPTLGQLQVNVYKIHFHPRSSSYITPLMCPT